jgi:hypothetical protein
MLTIVKIFPIHPETSFGMMALASFNLLHGAETFSGS